MGSTSGMMWRWSVAALVLLLSRGNARADVTTERSSSILIFPKVVSTTGAVLALTPSDTIIQISNTSNSLVFVHCFYVNAAPADPSRPASAANPPQWQEVDFDILLTKQQPTHWLVSRGRQIGFGGADDRTCNADFHQCGSAGIDPGHIPPVPDPFVGELKCFEVDQSGAPISGNHLKGEATIVSAGTGDASKYNAIGVLGLQNSNNSDNVLCLGGDVTDQCKTGAEYGACPQTVILNHFATTDPADTHADPVIEELGNGPSRVVTEVTLVPCSEDFENQTPPQVTVQFELVNEFEELFSFSTTVICWGNFTLDALNRIFSAGSLGTRFVQTRMTPATDDQPGFVGVAEELHIAPGGSARAALNLHGEGARPRNDVIVLPEAF